ncbi:Gfo/Idh/MocA family oxidoreductase [Planktomarina temperata]|nr:Gfo/Idh/MocA family oxidoreductase [bacterium]MDA9971778.1 Gfo/Idh/MocA family oxidoreductase [Planktomarina temperata]
MIKCGIIGLGQIGCLYDGGVYDGSRTLTHASCYNKHPSTVLVSVHDLNTKMIQNLQNARNGLNIKGFHNISDFFNSEIDCLSICSPAEFHAQHLVDALNKNIKYIWLEKPVCLSETETVNIEKARIASSSKVLVNYPRTFMIQYQNFKTECQSAIDYLRIIEVSYSRGLEENGVHILHFLLDLFGEVKPEIRWVLQRDLRCPSFGFVVDKVQFLFKGIDVDYHCIEVVATFETKRIAIKQSGNQYTEELVSTNKEFKNSHLLSEPVNKGNVHISTFSEGMFSSLHYLISSNAVNKFNTLEQGILADRIIRDVRNFC